MKKIIFLAFSTLILVAACTRKTTTVTAPTTTVEEEEETANLAFLDNKTYLLSDVLAKAKAEKKWVFVDAYATWCAPCKIMEKEVFTQKSVVSMLQKDFIAYKVNTEKNNGSTIALLYEVQALPTLLILDADGKVISKKENALGTSQFISWVSSVVKNK
jgi:thiol:disulfide interchange protein